MNTLGQDTAAHLAVLEELLSNQLIRDTRNTAVGDAIEIDASLHYAYYRAKSPHKKNPAGAGLSS